jgi:hypothetical protein
MPPHLVVLFEHGNQQLFEISRGYRVHRKVITEEDIIFGYTDLEIRFVANHRFRRTGL